MGDGIAAGDRRRGRYGLRAAAFNKPKDFFDRLGPRK
jgi:hypothetical protein